MSWYFDDAHGDWYCGDCQKPFARRPDIIRHLSTSSRHNFCGPCEKDFQSYDSLQQHYQSSSKHAYCVLCNTLLCDHDELAEHQADVHYPCGVCNLVFNTDQARRGHCRKDHPYCAPCDRAFQNENNLRMHMNSSVHKPRAYHCPGHRCKQSFLMPSDVVLHLESGACPSGINRAAIDKYIIDNDVRNAITNPRRMITGGAAGGPYVPPAPFIATNAAWNGSAFECYLCHGTYRTLPGLNQHLASPRHSTSGGGKIYRCPNGACGVQFYALSGLVQHIERGNCGVQKFHAVQKTIQSFVGGASRLSLTY